MKEAAGEANLTVVAIILIAVVVAVATPLVTSLMKNASRKSCCTDAGGKWSGNDCGAPDGSVNTYDSKSYDACLEDNGIVKKAE